MPPAPAPAQNVDFASAERGDFRQNPKYIAITKMQEEVKAIQLPPRTSLGGQEGDLSTQWAQQFEAEAIATEKLNLWWLNKKLTEIGAPSVTNVEAAIQDATQIISVLAHVAGQKPPKYNKKARMAVQMRDNWSALVVYMKSLGIRVDDSRALEEGEISVKLDAQLLGDLDRREIMKLFTKIMVYENKLIKRREAS